MKRISLMFLCGGLFLGCVCAVYAESSVTVTPKVRLAGKQGEDVDTDAYIGPVYFPDFYKSDYTSGGDAACANYLEGLRNEKMYPGYIDKEGFLKDYGDFLAERGCEYCCNRDFETGECHKFKIDGNKEACKGIDAESGLDLADEDGDGDKSEDRQGKITVEEDDYYDLAGMSGEITIDPGYETQGKVLFSWTVRVEGFNPEDVDHYTGETVNGIAVWPALCGSWGGTSHQDYSGGQVKTQLYVEGVNVEEGKGEKDGYAAVGEPVEMTIPTPKVSVVSHMPPPPRDPTLTGSFLLTPGDFSDHRLPSVISYKLKWCNHSAIRIKSPAGQRSLTVTLMPVTQE